MARSLFPIAGILLPVLLCGTPAVASDAAAPFVPLETTSGGPAALPGQPFANAAIADDARLADITGMADVRVIQETNNAQNTSTVSGNTINGDPTSGLISIDGGSFGNFNGLAVISANTGNNVSINSSMNVNVAIQQ